MLKLKIPPAALFIIFTGMIWGINRFLPNTYIAFPYQKWMITGILGIGVVIGLLGVLEFLRNSTTVNPHKPEKTRKLVTSGVYKVSRNPMYLGLFLGILAIVIHQGNIWSMIVLPLFVWYMNEYQIKPEEEMLGKKFGDEYQKYKYQVDRWFGKNTN